jgi:hypothetical protein
MPPFIYLLGLRLALIGLALAVTDWVMGPCPGATEANCRRIRAGKKMKLVEALLGGPGQWFMSAPFRSSAWSHYRWEG